MVQVKCIIIIVDAPVDTLEFDAEGTLDEFFIVSRFLGVVHEVVADWP